MSEHTREVTKTETYFTCDLCWVEIRYDIVCHGCQRMVCDRCQARLENRPLCKTCSPIWKRFGRKFREHSKAYEALIGQRQAEIAAALKEPTQCP